MKNYSIWLNNIESKKCKKITQNLNTDVLIIGGGISGISCLYQLKNNNIKTILVEKNICGHGVTSRSTAKITYLQEQIYMKIREYNCNETAKLYLKSQIEATNLLKDIVEKEGIDCNFEKYVDSYIFTDDISNISKIKEEYNFLKKLQC